MVCRRYGRPWTNAMAKVRRQHPSYGLNKRRKLAGSIVGGSRKK